MGWAGNPLRQRRSANWLKALTALLLAAGAYLLLAELAVLPPPSRLRQEVRRAARTPVDLSLLDGGLGVRLRIGEDAEAMLAAAKTIGLSFTVQDIGSGRSLIRRSGASISTRDGLITSFELRLTELADDPIAGQWVKRLDALGFGPLACSGDFRGHTAGETADITQGFPLECHFDNLVFNPCYKLHFEQGKLLEIRGMLNAAQ